MALKLSDLAISGVGLATIVGGLRALWKYVKFLDGRQVAVV